MRVIVMDGQGGGIGAAIIKAIRQSLGQDLEIWAVGTNSAATSRMMKAGANRGASGENAFVQTTKKADVMIGPISILLAHSMMGEVTPAMAEAVSSGDAVKILLPLTRENIQLVGVSNEPLPHLVQQVIDRLTQWMHPA